MDNVRNGYLVLPDGSTREEHPDTLAVLHSLFGSDVLMNNTSGRYLSDHIEELIAKRAEEAVKQAVAAEREACATLCASLVTNDWDRSGSEEGAFNIGCEECAAAIRARSEQGA